MENNIVNTNFNPTEVSDFHSITYALDSLMRRKFETLYRNSLASDSALLNKVLDYIFERKGKGIRPICVFLAAKATMKPLTEHTYVAAAAIEMIHTASLVHDDVIDASEQRRGNKSINAEWSSKIAVLTGDYILSKALAMISQHNMVDAMNIIARLTYEMTTGEMIQIEKSIDMDTTETVYFDIIKRKTALLMGAAMEIGAKSTGADELAQLMHDIGLNIGMAFQIKDDVFDFEKTNLLGKPTGNDIVERKITLPLIYALQQADGNKRKTALKCVKDAALNRKNISKVRDFVIENNGLQYAMSVAQTYVEKAVSLISTLENSPAKQSLVNLSYYAINRVI
ncbi:MAG: polyprenyl synthetase family protein [Prevotellaceae bacterium]|jgi:octaprenyl-diphosphate synthase|nr:polyprenyl synthetase family protein [Prevotellaceae bacterium]